MESYSRIIIPDGCKLAIFVLSYAERITTDTLPTLYTQARTLTLRGAYHY
jgi:hypothetical protein